jgi:monoamine oxidase
MKESVASYMNPTDDYRHSLLKETLEMLGRPEDYEYIIKLLSPPADITSIASPGSLKGLKIGILGGGVAGLAAAFELRKTGADITILEAEEERVGGRVYTYYFDEDRKYYAEYGPMRIPVSHETTWHYINLFQLDTISLKSPNPNTFRYIRNTRIRVTDSIEQNLYPLFDLTPAERNTPWAEIIEYAFEYAIKQLTPEVRAEILQILPQYSPEYLPFINLSLRQFIEALGLSQGVLELMYGLNPLAGSLYSASYDESTSDEYSVDFLNIYRVKDGFIHLPLAFLDSFRDQEPMQYRGIPKSQLGKVVFKPGHMVTGIFQKQSNPNKIEVRYLFNSKVRETSETFDYVICSLPFSALRDIVIKPFLQDLKMQAIYEYSYIDSQKSAFFCNQRFWERNTTYGNINGGISTTDLPVQSIVYPGDHINSKDEQGRLANEPGVLVASYNLGQESTRLGNLQNWRRYQVIKQNVEEVHGLPKGFLNNMIQDFKTVHWNREPNFRGAFAMGFPGQKGTFAYEMLQPEYNNRLYFAGEHISVKHGWLQGALYTGMDAANKLAKHAITIS